MTPLRIIFAASGEFAVPTLRALIQANHQVLTVVSQPDRPAGRGRALTPTPTAQAAIEMGLPLIRTDDLNTLSETGQLPEADVMVVIAFGQKLSDAAIHRPRFGSINLHASLLPRHRGAAPINWAILSGDPITGNSIIRLAQRMDAGAVLATSQVIIGELETAGELHDRLAIDGAPLVLRTIDQLATGTSVEIEQDHSKATIAKKLSRESARIDWNKSADEIARQIRGMYPWPGCRVELFEAEKALSTLTLVRARAGSLALPETVAAGTIVDAPGVSGVVAGDGRLVEIVEVQPTSKRPMTLAAFQRGHRWESGMRLHAI
jgi:methionyl-tRNA formyltransferase